MRTHNTDLSGSNRSRLFVLLTAAALAAASISACTDQSGSTTESQSQGTVQSATASSGEISQSTAPMTVEEAMASNHDYWTADRDEDEQEETITLTGSSATSSSAQVVVSGSTVTIKSAGRYVVSGDLEGSLVVDAGDEAQVTVVLNGATIHNAAGAAFVSKTADGVYLELAEGTTNEVSDDATFTADAEENAALFSHTDLEIGGAGSLAVTGKGEDGIASKDDLVISGGTITVTATDDGIRGKDALVITGGNVDVTAGGDGLKTTNEDEADRGYFLITGGNVTISAGSDGIDAITDALFAGGSVTITKSEEGAEAMNVIQGDGTLDITSSDDGLNATTGSTSTTNDGASGTDDSTTEGDTFSTDPAAARGGMGGMGGDTDDGSNLVIYGGILKINAGGDGIDSNGALTISGGEVTVFGTDQGGNGAFDANGTFTLSGGTVLAVSAGQMEQLPSEVSQAYVSTTVSGAAGDTLTVTAEDGTALSVETPKSFGYVLYSSPDLSEGQTVTLTSGGGSVEATATLDGSGGGMGQMGGNPGGGQMPEGGGNTGGGQMPEGQMPEDMQLPDGMEAPGGMEPPTGTQNQEGTQMPSGQGGTPGQDQTREPSEDADATSDLTTT